MPKEKKATGPWFNCADCGHEEVEHLELDHDHTGRYVGCRHVDEKKGPCRCERWSSPGFDPERYQWADTPEGRQLVPRV